MTILIFHTNEGGKMNTIYGYARISTRKQSIDRQIRNICKAYPDAVIVAEAYTGTTTDRPQFKKLLDHLKPNDTVVFDSVSRMSRNAQEGYELYEKLFKGNINLVFLKEPHINTDTYRSALSRQISYTGETVDLILQGVNEYLMALAGEQIRIAFQQSQKEVDDLRQRTREGMRTAAINGRQIGSKKGSTYHTKKSDMAKKTILTYSKDFEGTLNDGAVIKLAGISRNTYYKYKRELLIEKYSNLFNPDKDPKKEQKLYDAFHPRRRPAEKVSKTDL